MTQHHDRVIVPHVALPTETNLLSIVRSEGGLDASPEGVFGTRYAGIALTLLAFAPTYMMSFC